MARTKFGRKEALESAESQAETFVPAFGGIFSPGRAIGRVAGKEVTEEMSKRLIADSQKAKSFVEQMFPSTIRVMVKQPKIGGGFTRFVDEVKGLNSTHAAMRAEANWPGSQISILNEAVKKNRVLDILKTIIGQ